MKGHLLLEKRRPRVSQNLLWFEKAPLVINPDVIHPHLPVEPSFVKYLVAGGCPGRSLPNFISVFFQEQHAPGCRLFTPAALGLCTWEMPLPCSAHFISVIQGT